MLSTGPTHHTHCPPFLLIEKAGTVVHWSKVVIFTARVESACRFTSMMVSARNCSPLRFFSFSRSRSVFTVSPS